jgi:hypothetical protein
MEKVNRTYLGVYSYVGAGKKSGIWVNGSLMGAGEIIHVDHKISGVFFNNNDMEMPVSIQFKNTGTTRQILDHNMVGMQAAPVPV